jgi:hypothetical protein
MKTLGLRNAILLENVLVESSLRHRERVVVVFEVENWNVWLLLVVLWRSNGA